MVVYIFNLSTQEAELGRLLWVWGEPGLHSEFQDKQKHERIKRYFRGRLFYRLKMYRDISMVATCIKHKHTRLRKVYFLMAL